MESRTLAKVQHDRFARATRRVPARIRKRRCDGARAVGRGRCRSFADRGRRRCPKSAMARTGYPSDGVCYLINSPSLQARDRKKRFTVHGLRKVGIRLQLHLYRAPACEMQRFIRCGVLLRPSPEHRGDHGWWRILDLRSAHSLPRGAGAQKLVKIYMHLRNCLFLPMVHIFWAGACRRGGGSCTVVSWQRVRGPSFPQLERQWKVATKRQPK